MLPEFKASFYAILKNGRSFSLISDLDEKWKNILSYFPSISTIFGFLFGLKQDSNAKHGFEYTGKISLRTFCQISLKLSI